MLTIANNLCDHRDPTSTLAWKEIALRYFNAAGAKRVAFPHSGLQPC